MSQGDPVANAHALAAQVNAHGGLAGHSIEVIPYAEDAQSTQPVEQQAQAMCTYFTQDHPVTVVLSGDANDHLALPCLTSHGVVLLESTLIGVEDSHRDSELAFNLIGMNAERAATATVGALVGQRWFGGWDTLTGGPASNAPAKVGVLYSSTPDFDQAVTHVLLPALRAAGHAVDPTDVVPAPAGGNGPSAISSAVLRFRNDRVTHVVILDNGGVVTLLFTNAASSQHYYPRLGGNTANGFQGLVQAHDIPAASLSGLVLAGWTPAIDRPWHLPHDSYTPRGQASCLAVLHKAGITFPDANSELVALLACDQFFILAEAARLTGDVSGAGISAGFEQVGTSAASATDLALRLDRGHHDGVAAYADAAFADECGCVRYVGPIRALG